MSTAADTRVITNPLPFRLRSVLGGLLVGAGLLALVPRARAAWQLHGLVSKVADYGLCMAGPTGAVAIRDEPLRFRNLVRRRLVAANPADTPFARCANLAREISGRGAAFEGYAEPAVAFLEWGAGGSQSLNRLLSDLPDLESLHDQSWPFARKPLGELIRSSRGAYEAIHPMELGKPVAVQGLALGNDGAIVRSTVDSPRGLYVVESGERAVTAFRSRDQGRTWSSTSPWQAALEGHAHHCVANPSGTRFAIAPARAGAPPALLIGSLVAMADERHEFGRPEQSILRVACDDSGAVVLTQDRVDHSQRIYACPLASHCREVVLPPDVRAAGASLDVARVSKTLVVALAKDGLVRVTSSRDEGATLAPWSLVVDTKDAALQGLGGSVTPHLLAFGQRLQLVVAVPGSRMSWSLRSSDLGASFHAP